MNFTELVSKNKIIQEWLGNFQQSKRQLLTGVSSSLKSILISTAYAENDLILVVTSSQNAAEKLISDLISVIGEEAVYSFIADDQPQAEFIFASPEKIQARVDALQMLTMKKKGIVVANLAATRLFLPSPIIYRDLQFDLQVGEEYPLNQLEKTLQSSSYVKVSQVQNPGEYSLRGDILDVFCVNQEHPYRVEFFSDEIDGIRSFNPENQLSLQQLTKVTIKPASDLVLSKEDFDRGRKTLELEIEKTTNTLLKSYLEEILSVTNRYSIHEDIRRFLSIFYEKEWTILDYISKEIPIFIDEYQKFQDQRGKFEYAVSEMSTQYLQDSKALSTQLYFIDNYKQIRQHKPITFFSKFQKGLGNMKFDAMFQINSFSIQNFFGEIPFLVEELNRYSKKKDTVVLAMDSQSSLQKLTKSLEEYELIVSHSQPDQLQNNGIQIIESNLSNGFYFADANLVVISEHDIYQKRARRRIRLQNQSNVERLKNYNELEVGDYVVHNVHGIGKYLGIETIQVSGVHRDYLTVQYQQSDRISIPVDQIQLLSKYVASDGKTPKINKLNDGRFQKTKQKVEKQVEDIAEELLELYAAREEQKGFAFSEDSPLQKEFDDAFPHVETEDQIRSIHEIKMSMQDVKPMDRLLVGDVGFGKTEVAMRAAFKAVENQKQVAVLVPTTVLAQQHYNSFKERFMNFAVNVEVLSRFQTKKEQEDIIEKLSKGQVDIIIGTHRLLSKDVNFLDLGLIIIDEEQRFGVKHKEKLKQLKTKVDVLTLTATPIPRTLHMSMLGIRDLSVIETPPTNRYPVQTYVLEKNDTVIREAILREIDRGGQIYYLYNRVETIERKISELKELVPEARIGFVHGQMTEVKLENTLMDFIDGVYDVLVTTTIIETGVDIPNANTLFIEDADRMGLSTLYQLRGRVGRSNRIAYAYLMYRPEKSLSEVSEKRLDAIKGFTDLGSGFKIAMRDLSIRGAGNILGASQSGFIDSVGFELYSELLQAAIRKRQGKEEVSQKSNAEILLQMDAYIPSEYIGDERQKIEIYKRIREISNHDTYVHLQDELIDRFGDYPDSLAYLIEIGYLKSTIDQVFAEQVNRKNDQVLVRFEKRANQLFLTQDYFEALSQMNLKASIGENKGKIEITFNVKNKKDYEILENLQIFAEKLVEIKGRKITEN